jgi:hypothetical protein
MVAVIEKNSAAAGEKRFVSVIDILKNEIRNSEDLQAGDLENPSPDALASFLVTVIREDGDVVSLEDVDAYLEQLCQNADTSRENGIIAAAAAIARKALQEGNQTEISPEAISEAITEIGGFTNTEEPSVAEQFAAELAKRGLNSL